MTNTKQFLVGKKIGMSQIIDESGNVLPVTIVRALENEIVRLKTAETDGYSSVCLGYNEVDKKKLSKPLRGQFKGENSYLHIKEFRVPSTEGFELGKKIAPGDFELNSKFNAQSKTIGRGFTGATKKWHFSQGPMSHGSKNHRLLGSIGQGTTPGRVYKGKKMHTRYGNENVTILNLVLLKIDGDHLFLKGAIPGKEGIVYLTGAR